MCHQVVIMIFTVLKFYVISLTTFRLYLKCRIKYCESKGSMVGRVVIVTGANTGIGYETAKELSKRGARVILACRNEEKGNIARNNIVAETGNLDVIYKHLDLSSLDSVRSFADDVINTEASLHVLINNAGVFGLSDRYTRDNIVEEIQINHFAPFLLTLLLLPLLKKSKPSRIINLTSMIYHFGTVNFERINMKNAYIIEGLSYVNSKLCNLIFTVELARRTAGSGVVVNAVHPGVIATNIISTLNSLLSKVLFSSIYWVAGRTANQGAQTVLHLAVSEECEKVSGEYFVDCSARFKSWKVMDRTIAKELWKFSEDLVNYKYDF